MGRANGHDLADIVSLHRSTGEIPRLSVARQRSVRRSVCTMVASMGLSGDASIWARILDPTMTTAAPCAC
jgi:hypothetical protein